MSDDTRNEALQLTVAPLLGEHEIHCKRDMEERESWKRRSWRLCFALKSAVGEIVAVVDEGAVGDAVDEEDVAGECGVVDGDVPPSLG